ncbi:MAG: tetratricopeptide repeat protein [Aggregatilineales bacterium]
MPTDALRKTQKALLNNRYQLVRQLGVGGMGTVYEVIDRLSGETLALKHVHTLNRTFSADHHDARVALSAEFRTLASLRHPNIITVIDYGFDEKQHPFFTMSLLKDTKNIVAVGIHEDTEGKVNLLIQMLQALAYLHRRNIIHRDLKPANVLVTSEGTVKVLDFGVALNENHTIDDQQEVTVGTLAYMAPELFMERPATIESDLYSVGIMAYQMFTGKHPFNNKNMASLVNSVMRDQPNLNIVDSRIAPIIEHLLQKPSEARYHNAEDVINELSDAIDIAVPAENVAIRESFLQASRFVGREKELATLRDALENVLDEDEPGGSAWIIGGESGVGKSRLVEELRIRALVYGIQVLRAQYIADSSLPYHAWREPLRRLALSTHIEPDEASILKAIIPDIGDLLGYQVENAPILDGMEARTRLIETLTHLFRKQTQPTLLIMEDLHWADDSLNTLRAIINHVKSMSLIIVCTYRDDERSEIADLLPEASLIRLGRLPKTAIAELSESILGSVGKQPNLVSLITKETEGNVFFIVEVIRALAEQAGSLRSINETEIPKNVLSGGIQQVIKQRLQHVPDEAQPLLKLAAIIGRQLDMDLLHTLNTKRQVFVGFDLKMLTVESWLTICANCAVLEAEDGHWHFAHDKLREAVLATLTHDERSMLYRQVAEATEAVYEGSTNKIAALADYWHEAKDTQKELYYVRLAIDETSHINAFRETIRYINRAIDLLRNHPTETDWQHQAADLKIQMGEAYGYLGAFDEARKHLQESADLSRKLGNRNAIARALNAIGDLDQDQGEYESATRNHKISLTLFRETNDLRGVTNALTDLGRTTQSKGDYSAARQYYDEALRICRQTNDFDGIAECLEYLGNISEQQGNLDNAQHYYEESLAVVRDMADFSRIAGMLDNLGNVAQGKRDYPAAQIYYNESLAIYRRISNELGSALVLGNLGNIALIQKNYLTAQTYCEESLRTFREIDNRLGIAFSLNSLGNVALGQGDVAIARANYQEALIICQATGVRGGIASGYNHLGWIDELENNDSSANRHYLNALNIYREMGDREKIAGTLTNLSFVKIRLGKLEDAQAYLQEALQIAWQISAVQPTINVLIGLAQKAYASKRYKHSAELIGVVSQYVDLDDVVIEHRLEPLLKQLQTSMDADVLLGTLEYGRVSLDLATLVESLLQPK